MLCWTKPEWAVIENFVSEQATQAFTHPHVRCTRFCDTKEELMAALGDDKNSFDTDHHRVQIGSGGDCFRKASEALEKWQHFSLEWAELHPANAAVVEGTTVAVLIHNMGFYSLSACRIVYVIDESEEDVKQRFGFAYGTMPRHLISGEERFLVEWDLKNDAVYYDILSFSQPQHWMSKVGYPVSRWFQATFGRDSTQAMLNAVSKEDDEGEAV